MENDPKQLEKAKKVSWLNKIFQKNSLTAVEKKEVLKEVMEDFKKQRGVIHGKS